MTDVTGYTVGVYDMFHVGHLRHLSEARSRCDRLVVGVLDDAAATTFFGAPPFVPMCERMDVLASLECVDEVAPAGLGDGDAGLPPAWRGFDVFFVGTDRDVPLAAHPAGTWASTVVLPDAGGTAAPLLRSVLARVADGESVA